jgi:hypothetical protein
MKLESVVIRGTVLPDGTLQVSGKVGLPAGPVEVEVRPLLAPKEGESLLEVLARIRADQEARGHVPRTVEEIDAQLREEREGWAERDAMIDALHEEACRARREQSEGAS